MQVIIDTQSSKLNIREGGGSSCQIYIFYKVLGDVHLTVVPCQWCVVSDDYPRVLTLGAY